MEAATVKSARTIFVLLASWCVLVAGARAADKEVTLKGQVVCAKCELKEAKTCQTAIQVKEGGRDVTYYFKDRGKAEEYHEAVCGGGRKPATVTGVVSEKDGKKWITP